MLIAINMVGCPGLTLTGKALENITGKEIIMYATDRISSKHNLPGAADATLAGNKRRGTVSRLIRNYQRCFEGIADPDSFMPPM